MKLLWTILCCQVLEEKELGWKKRKKRGIKRRGVSPICKIWASSLEIKIDAVKFTTLRKSLVGNQKRAPISELKETDCGKKEKGGKK